MYVQSNSTSGTGTPAGKGAGGMSGVGAPVTGLSGKGSANQAGAINPQSNVSGNGLGGMLTSSDQYFQQNPDVAKAFQENNYGLSQEDFAKTHFEKYGQAEGRSFGQQPQVGQPNPYANTVSGIYGGNSSWDRANVMPPMGGGKGGKAGSMSGGGKGQSNYTPLPPISQYQQPKAAPANNFAQVASPTQGVNSDTSY